MPIEKETECTEFGCRLEQAKKSLDEWVRRHDADKQRIEKLEGKISRIALYAEQEMTEVHNCPLAAIRNIAREALEDG